MMIIPFVLGGCQKAPPSQYFMKKDTQDKLKKEYFLYNKKLLDQAWTKAFQDVQKNNLKQEDKLFYHIWYFLQSRRIRRSNHLNEEQKEKLQQTFFSYTKEQYEQKKSLNFYLFDLPIKTGKNAPPSPDLGEELMLHNLNTIAEFIAKIYPFGVHFYILSDGYIFSLGQVVSTEYIDSYISQIQKIAKKNNLKQASVVDWHKYIFTDNDSMFQTFLNFQREASVKDYLTEEVMNKTKERARELVGKECTLDREEKLLCARAFFEKTKQDNYASSKNTIHPEFGFRMTKVAFKRETPILSIYPVDPHIEVSVSRGCTELIRKPSSVIYPKLSLAKK